MSITQTNKHRSTECVINDYLIREKERERETWCTESERRHSIAFRKISTSLGKRKRKKGSFFYQY